MERPMKIMIIEEKNMTADIDRDLKNALCRCFPADAEIFSQSRAWHGSASAWSVIIEIEGCIAAHVGIVDRLIKAGDFQLQAAGIQNVFVLPEYRGQGLGEKVMNAAMQEAEKRNFDVGLLYCVPQLEKLYAGCGWRLLPRQKILRHDENGNIVPLPEKNIAMFFPLKVKSFPEGAIDLQGNDW